MIKKLFILFIGLTFVVVVEARGMERGAQLGRQSTGLHSAGNAHQGNKHPTAWNGRYHQNQAYYANGQHGGRYWNGGYYGGMYYAPGWVGGYCVPGYYSYPACLTAFSD